LSHGDSFPGRITGVFSTDLAMRQPSSLKAIAIVLSLVLSSLVFLTPTPPVLADTAFQPMFIASIFSFSGKRPTNLGVKDGKLGTCPSSPNCVSSNSSDEQHKIEPLTYQGDGKAAFEKLKSIIASIESAKMIQAETHYLYAEFTSKLMGFVDDVEFYLDENAGIIQVRSASRLGQSDLGVNRKRIEDIRTKFNA
jgi:uncharacterized protein (DUF1499 family)